MPIRSRKQAVASVSIRESVFVGIFHEVFDEFYDKFGSVAVNLEGWTKASIIRDLIKDRVQRFADIDPGLEMVRRGNATSMMMDKAFLIRTKKQDEQRRPRVSRTKASMQFNRNSEDQGAFDLGDCPLTTGYLGYTTNENDLRRPSLYFVVNGPDGRHAWEPIELSAAAPAVIGLPQIAAPEEKEPVQRSRARVKANPKQNRRENG
jgi:hypothetical protein